MDSVLFEASQQQQQMEKEEKEAPIEANSIRSSESSKKNESAKSRTAIPVDLEFENITLTASLGWRKGKHAFKYNQSHVHFIILFKFMPIQDIYSIRLQNVPNKPKPTVIKALTFSAHIKSYVFRF